ncbi:hypothetical protein JMJ77_0004696 [Colletotrichum scovillei]|uniref:Uncharacterized protein n=1 Tax=Colletotrichum scovillei TaxID=1209932 RepID=A0A9P7RFQ8_9PEZI|nr:hypothetical protein JMJ77_0004696 [Colletotrichum scovillei]KAG7075904.1 hypothetical protein JMJ76_0013178 [Colletotrichum scovillei]KAG7083018.1 hypothetical protein JMJ78_0008469 [Colletotrichum scovillei]
MGRPDDCHRNLVSSRPRPAEVPVHPAHPASPTSRH